MKRLLSYLICLTLVVSFPVISFAVNETNTETQRDIGDQYTVVKDNVMYYYDPEEADMIYIEDHPTNVDATSISFSGPVKFPSGKTLSGSFCVVSIKQLEYSSVTLATNTVEIKSKAITVGPSLQQIFIPPSVKTIGEKALGYYYNGDANEYVKVTGFTILGNAGSAAEKYAKENGFKFRDVNGLRVKNLWASQHSVGKVLFKWTKKDGVIVDGWNIKYRTRKIGGNNSWSGWTTKSFGAAQMDAWIDIKADYVIEIHAQAKGDSTWSTGIITCPAGGKYQAMKNTYVLNTTTNKRLDSFPVLKVGQSIKVRPDYEYSVLDYNKRPRLYPNHMLYDVADKSILTITKPDGSSYTGGMIDGVATITGAKAGTTQIIFRAPNGRTQTFNVRVVN